MGLGSYVRKFKAALRGGKGRQLLDQAESAARRATGGRHDEKIKKARDAADRAIGLDDDDPNDRPAGRR
ncbi:Rv0909 family putative TA system antitoxin [Brevibacterium sp. GP-SGM9]|uniref:Rv0909 family putative TA system antitoxin n=1 Tax=unclassified Brevibacterium TaxID=2614124 RepID=UPI001E44C55D|nr:MULTISPECIES: Rv0909 family putative TA system antitoxin [unclassified Brevibacterium]MDK8436382.1 Rv0909 family putative TA system antitoxin [Brevibacterium sp. H-BE7]